MDEYDISKMSDSDIAVITEAMRRNGVEPGPKASPELERSGIAGRMREQHRQVGKVLSRAGSGFLKRAGVK